MNIPCVISVLVDMMTSSNGNIFCVTGPLCGEFTGHQWIPNTKASDAQLWCFLWIEYLSSTTEMQHVITELYRFKLVLNAFNNTHNLWDLALMFETGKCSLKFMKIGLKPLGLMIITEKTCKFVNVEAPLLILWSSLEVLTQIAKFMGPTWGPPGSCQSQVGPMLVQ